MYDIGIIGGGTAGLTAAIYGLRAGKKVLLAEGGAFGGQIVFSSNVENYPGIQSMSGNDFADSLLGQAKALGVETKTAKVTGIRETESGKVLVTGKEEYECKTVIIATGATHRHLGVAREEELIGGGVSYCAVCDGAFFRNMKVAVVGGGNTALQDAAFLSAYCEKVYVIHRRDEFRGEDQLVNALKEKENVEFVLDSVVTELQGKDYLEHIEIENVKTKERRVLDAEGLFVAIGQAAQNDAFKDLVELDDGGYIVAGEDCQTTKAGIFVAGDCRTKEVRQLTTAASDGAVAALAACKYIDRGYGADRAET